MDDLIISKIIGYSNILELFTTLIYLNRKWKRIIERKYPDTKLNYSLELSHETLDWSLSISETIIHYGQLNNFVIDDYSREIYKFIRSVSNLTISTFYQVRLTPSALFKIDNNGLHLMHSGEIHSTIRLENIKVILKFLLFFRKRVCQEIYYTEKSTDISLSCEITKKKVNHFYYYKKMKKNNHIHTKE